jgi:hypothetical protein
MSLTKIHEWMDLLSTVPDEKKLLVGTKLDIGSQIPEEDILEIAEEYGLDFILISSKTGENFDNLIIKLKEIVCESD